MELVLDRLTKRYRQKTAVDGFSASLRPGVYGLLGANGSGKTTLLRMLADILEPSGGDILLDGVPVSRLDEEYRDIIGYLPQSFGVYGGFTAMDFLLYLAAAKGVPSEDAPRKARELLAAVGLLGEARSRVKSFSGGMKQRLGIAQALLNDPLILLLDEPTAGLDPGERVRFFNILGAMCRKSIVLFSTHIVSDAESAATRVLMMREGRLISSGAPDEVAALASGRVWSLRTTPAEAERIRRSAPVSGLRHTEGSVELRVVSERPPHPRALGVPPTLEDAFLYCFGEGGR